MSSGRGQQRSVFYAADCLTWRMALGYVLERRTHRQHPETLPHRQRFETAQGGKGKLEHGVGFDQLLRQGRIHIVYVRGPVYSPHGCSNERAFFDGVNQIVLRPTHHSQALREHENITDHFLGGESGSNVPDPQGAGYAMDATIGDSHVLTFVECQHIHLVSAPAEKFQHGLHGEGSTPSLEEGMWRKNQYLHATVSKAVRGARTSLITASISSATRRSSHPHSAAKVRAAASTAPRCSFVTAPSLVRRNTRSLSLTAISCRTARKISSSLSVCVTCGATFASSSCSSAVRQGGMARPSDTNTRSMACSTTRRAVVNFTPSTKIRYRAPLADP